MKESKRKKDRAEKREEGKPDQRDLDEESIYIYDSPQSEPMTFDKETNGPIGVPLPCRLYRHRQSLLLRQHSDRLGSTASLRTQKLTATPM